MAESVAKTSKLSLKILYDKKSKKVFFAEADKEAVDFLFYMMSLPLATVTSLLSKSDIGMVGCLNNLHESVSNLDQIYFHDDKNKDLLLNPLHSFSVQAPLLLPVPENTNCTNYKIYKCEYHSICSIGYITECTECNFNKRMYRHRGEQIAVPDGNGSGFVESLVKYIVMDNLVVKPISPISSICFLKDFNVKDLANVHEVVVVLGLDEGLKILKASMEGESVITSVFLDKLV
ncbi:uncharacterized protein LOC124935260 [Impatiens glandulifera]|uniref:uncharacterized protein LOC124935260 n=1 Tax=Impatiens glandulifera TaxID=253017 RepID=UPI001FB0DE09|nr:uncharacterized protein LOC124935260 [Impatiens glandulifera]